MKLPRFCRYLFVSTALAALSGIPIQTPPALAQSCTPDLKAAPVLPEDTTALAVGLRWCGLIGAPSVDDPSLVGSDSFKEMLWRRHERASECIWIPQCKITLRSAAGITKDDYQKISDIDDPDLTNDDAGDVVIRVIQDEEGVADYSELRTLWQNCDLAWGEQDKGMLALSLGRFIQKDGDTASVIGVEGVALDYDDVSDPDSVLERPAISVVDPTFAGDADTERVLAHEAGHKFGLCHTNEEPCTISNGASPNIMVSSVNGITLTEGQCDAARGVVDGHPQLDPPAGSGTVLGLIDGKGDPDEPTIPDLMDIRKLVAVDNSVQGKGLTLALRMQGPLGANQVVFVFALDTDNDTATGAPIGELSQGSGMTGVDVAFLVTANENGVSDVQVRKAAGGSLPVIAVDGVSVQRKTVMVREIGPAALPAAPLASDIILTVQPEAFPALSLTSVDGRMFPNGLAIQASSTVTLGDGETFVDLGPDASALLGFPTSEFPAIAVAGPACAGDQLQVSVERMPAHREISAFLGETKFLPGVITDAAGNAAFSLTVPEDAVPGSTLLTVGIVDQANAVTADTIVSLCPDDVPPPGSGQKRYVAKLVCGVQPKPESLNLVRGRYATTINVINTGRKPVTLSKELSLAVPPGNEKPGRVFRIAANERLKRGQAMAVQCDDLRRTVFDGTLPASYVDGFVTIRSSGPLSVTAVYTSGALGDAQPSAAVSIDVQRIRAEK